ncbi:MAG TPA: phosphatase PAP2 family protein [Gammaproteobacteria bacterium]
MNKPDNLTNLGRLIFDLIKWIGRHYLHVLLWAAVLFGGIWIFAEIADEVMEGETRGVDEFILLSLRNSQDTTDPLGPAWLEEMGRDFTALGGTGVLTLIALVVVGYLLLSRRFRASLLVTVSVTGGILLSTLLKIGFDRPRPDLVTHESFVYTASFPSGHSMMAAVTYLTLAALLARVHAQSELKAYFLIVAAFLTMLVGISRVYLGVHWPTDVLAGWAAGAAWAALCWLIARWLQRRGMVESGD